MFEKFNEGAQRALILGQEAAAREKHEFLGTEHIMFGLLQAPGEVNAGLFRRLKMDLRKLVEQVETMLHKNVPMDEAKPDVPFSELAKKSLEKSVEIAKELGEENIGQEHLLLGMLSEPKTDASKAFGNIGFDDPAKLREEIRNEIESTKKRKTILAMLNEDASKALVHAKEDAREKWNDSVGTEHILLGMLRNLECPASRVLIKLGSDVRLLQKVIREITPPGKEKPMDGATPHLSLDAKTMIDSAEKEAKEMGHNYIGTEHLLLGMLSLKTCAAASALNRTGISNLKKVRLIVNKELETK
ncbi:MAG: hypothetical protein OEZ28_01030 [Nitrospinota bacterium]|nr:hypothetical protein [Nitrospinota bacterium]